MPKLVIDGKEVEIEEGLTVMQACEIAGVEIPHFCFHERLKIAGNCRMCLVDIEKYPKPVASCAMPASDGMVVSTSSAKVIKAREGVMEFLLINHPLDCPICDQGGECDLQDQSFKYGKGRSRYSENKRSVKDKNLGPLVATHMTRCIHCTRCIRFCTDVAGVPEMGTIGRGKHMEIVSYLEKTLTSELSGNVIDLCPVGALNSKPYAFTARSWELQGTESIDVMDAVGSNIRIDSRGLEVMRILPKLNEDINEEWLSDKARFSYDGLKNQRLDRPYVKKAGRFQEVSWESALSSIADKFNSTNDKSAIAAIAGFTVPCETLFLMKKLLFKLGADFCDANQLGYKFDLSARGNYLFNTTISGIEKADVCLLVGANPRQVAPVLNARIGKMVRAGNLIVGRIGKMVRAGNLIVGRIGEEDNQTYKMMELGRNVDILESLISINPDNEGSNDKSISTFARLLEKAANPMVIVGDGVLVRPDAHAILSLLHKIIQKYKIVRENWNGFNVLHNHASMVGALDLGFIYGNSGNGTDRILKKTQNGEIKILYLLGADDIDMSQIGDDTFVIYQGHHGDEGANRADVILPEAAYTEQDGIYVNMEGRPQFARAAVAPPGSAKTGVEIVNIVAKALELDIKIDELSLIRKRMAQEYNIFNHIDKIVDNDFRSFESSVKLTKQPLEKIVMNYYMTDPISRASITMAKCTKAIKDMQITEAFKERIEGVA